MKVIVIGAGKVGHTIIDYISQEGHEVVAVDNNAKLIEEIIDEHDIIGVLGHGASYDILKSAGVAKADLVVAATSSDEVNILACLVAKKLGAKSTIARVRSYEYKNQVNMLTDDFGITMTINPEAESAKEIMKILNFPQAIRVDSFANGNVDLVELYIPDNSPLVGKSLSALSTEYQVKVLVCAVQRNENVFIPDGTYKFEAKDKIHLTAENKAALRSFLNKSKLIQSKVKTVMIIGGGKITYYLAKDLLRLKYQVKIIEKDNERCLELSQLLPQATIILGDGTDQDLLHEEGINDADAVVSLTDIDEENMIISMYANKQNVHKVVAKINKSSFVSLMETVSMASVISPKDITASRIISHVRAKNNARGSNVVTLYKLVNGRVEALEFKAKDNKKLINICFKNLHLKKKTMN